MYDTRLQTFITVAEQGSFTAASKILFISPVAVMKQIDAFETEVGAKLFARTNQGVQLTRAGEIIFEEGKKVIKQCNDVMEKARLQEKSYIPVTVGYTFSEKTELIHAFWKSFMDVYPEYRVRVIKKEASRSGFSELYEQLGTSVDGIYTVAPPAVLLKRCSFDILGYYDLRIVVLNTSNLAKKEVVPVSDLKDKIMIVPDLEEGASKAFYDFISGLGCKIQWSKDGQGDFLDSFIMTANEDCVTISYDGHVSNYPSLTALPVAWDYRMSYGMLYPLNATVEFKRFLHCMKSHMESKQKS